MFASGATAQVVLDGVPVGTNNPNTGKFTNLEATTQFKLGSDTATSFDDIDSEKVKSSATDSTPGFLADELQAGSNVTIAGTENITISVPNKLTTKGDVLYHNGTTETRLGVGASGQILTTDTNDNLLWANPAEGDQLFNSNVLLNSYRTAENIDLSVLKMIDGAVDAFTDEAGVDTTASTNEAFNSTNDLYTPADDGTGITVPMVNFDGTADSLRVSETALGQSDGKSFLISVWIDPSSNNRVARLISMGGGETFVLDRTPSQQIRVFLRGPGSLTVIGDIKSTTTVPTTNGPHHVLIAIDMANTTIQIRIDGGPVETNLVATAIVNNTIDFANGDLIIGAFSISIPDLDWEGEMGHFYLAEEYLDISTAANLAKFYDNGNPVDLGSDGSTPTGTAPIIFLNNPVATWQNNLGSGGNFTVNGAITAGTDIVVPGDPEDLTLISNSQTAQEDPNDANILLLAEVVGADIVLNTDIKASVSQDGGTNFTQVTLEDAGEFEDGNLLTGSVGLPGTGTDMKWKVETFNNKGLNLHGVGLEWR